MSNKDETNKKSGGFFGAFKKLFGPSKRIKDFEIVTLHTTGMRYSTDNEIVVDGYRSEVFFYDVAYRHGEKVRRLRTHAACSKEEALALFNKCRLLSWNGFYGKRPKGVLDGTNFILEAVVNGGKVIRAHGSQHFPHHYRELIDGLYEILSRKEEKK
ncbi:MAG: hypothetical protein J6112_03395 [Clostridia bacterium]|nr:hypothetical protein [Clostridia bacterium]